MAEKNPQDQVLEDAAAEVAAQEQAAAEAAAEPTLVAPSALDVPIQLNNGGSVLLRDLLDHPDCDERLRGVYEDTIAQFGDK